mmetsp:Transcript_13242/g.37623  ORF Transcript_13242/g.37623 Transcript_13242/m.37623 type:complete len:213 (+) Transcript_13242:2456-3094(+)
MPSVLRVLGGSAFLERFSPCRSKHCSNDVFPTFSCPTIMSFISPHFIGRPRRSSCRNGCGFSLSARTTATGRRLPERSTCWTDGMSKRTVGTVDRSLFRRFSTLMFLRPRRASGRLVRPQSDRSSVPFPFTSTAFSAANIRDALDPEWQRARSQRVAFPSDGNFSTSQPRWISSSTTLSRPLAAATSSAVRPDDSALLISAPWSSNTFTAST